jgi:DNA polymerase III subunit epsilon
MKTYAWWGSGSSEPPPELKTKKQLREIGLAPVNPVGVIQTQKYDVYLYDPNDRNSTKPKRQLSPKQLEVLAQNRERAAKKRNYWNWYRSEGRFEIDRVAAVQWAQSLLERSNLAILDTETTGLYQAEIVEVAIVNSRSEPLLTSLVKPTISIPQEVITIHGITDLDVKDSPTFPEIYPAIAEALKERELAIYNASFDMSILDYCCKLHRLPLLDLSNDSHCIMQWYSQWVGEWSRYYGNYKYQALGGGHRALNDCLAALDRIKTMAADTPFIRYPPGIEAPIE